MNGECDVSIVIVNWNAKELIENCIDSIHEQTRVDYEIIVVDNASTDGSVEALRARQGITLIENPVNRGFAAANNQGINIARGRTILLLNPDTIILDSAVDRALLFSEASPDVAVVGVQVWESPDRVQPTCFGDPTPFHILIVRFRLQKLFPWCPVFRRAELTGWERDTERDVPVVSGMFMLVKREAIGCVGVLDGAFFVYGEEADWCYRFRKAGYRCVFTPSARILHLDGGSKSTVQVPVRMHLQLQKSLLYYNRKHGGVAAAILCRGIFVFSSVLRATYWGTIGRVRNDDSVAARSIAQARASLRYHLFGTESPA